MKVAVLWVFIAALLWCVMFAPVTSGIFNFWVAMSVSAGILAGAALWICRKEFRRLYSFSPKFLVVGVISAVVLYGIFWFGKYVSVAMFPIAGDQIMAVYGTKAQASSLVIGALLVLLIAPAEEIFWRGFVQSRFASILGDKKGYFCATAAYTIVHVFSLNPMLLVAALVCGLLWGFIFMRYRSLWPGIISHAVWDVAVFVIVPFK